MKKTISSLMVAVSAIAFATSANALEYNPYVGFDFSQANTTAEGNIDPAYQNLSINAGTSYNKYFGTEVFVQKSDTYHKKSEGEKFKTSFDAYGLDLMGYLPLGCDQVFSLVGTFGLANYDFNFKSTGTKNEGDNGLGWRTGLGAQYALDDNWSVRAIARHVNFNKIDGLDHMMEYSLGARYTF